MIRRTFIHELIALVALSLSIMAPLEAHGQSASSGASSDSSDSSETFNLPGDTCGNGMLGAEGGKSCGGGSRWGSYTMPASAQIESASFNNSAIHRLLKSALQVQIWISPPGSITRIKLIAPRSDPKIDAKFEEWVLSQLRLGPPPQGMPMPMILNFAPSIDKIASWQK